jgi:hypothetical protein
MELLEGVPVRIEILFDSIRNDGLAVALLKVFPADM